MATNLDDFFSPERLNRTWKRPAQSSEGAEAAVSGPASFPEILSEVREAIHERFAGQDAEVLDHLIDALQYVLSGVFPKAPGDIADRGPAADLLPAAHEALDRIEDLVEAFELSGRTAR